MHLVPAEGIEPPAYALRNFRKLCIRVQLRAIAHINSSTWAKPIVLRCAPMCSVGCAHYGIEDDN